MSIVFGAEIIALSVIINVSITILAAKLIIKAALPKGAMQAVKQFRTMMGERSQVVQHTAKQRQLAAVGKQKMTKAAIETLPMGGAIQSMIDKAGITPDELWATLQDEEFLKGIMVIYRAFGGLIGKITGHEGKKEDASQTQGTAFVTHGSY
jgi:Sec-independent protein translocase protein TatA